MVQSYIWERCYPTEIDAQLIFNIDIFLSSLVTYENIITSLSFYDYVSGFEFLAYIHFL